MAIIWNERPLSRDLTDTPDRAVLRYWLSGTQDDQYVLAYAKANLPAIYHGLWRETIRIDPQGFNLWYIDAEYGPIDPWEFKWNFDTTGGTAKVTHAFQHIADYPAAHNNNGAIGVNQNGEVEGCEIVVAQFKWTEVWQLPLAAASFAYSDTLELLTGKVNNAVFRGKPAGSVLFMGAQGSGSNKDPDRVEVTFHFVRDVGQTNLTYGSISGVDKPPHHYLWIEYQQQELGAVNRNVIDAIAVHVEKMYGSANFALLGIGT